ncbi:helicase-associated domain-containing protein [Planctomonas psychrotolerans]|uniref:helicase-associated domain-containing protein n=1 Tax=Planctomonas psychrotolerans TaxID=2528712 RepID=UPI0012390693|nr:helicase-associated domain-containing protein [Planctomonas psychrotolerans]
MSTLLALATRLRGMPEHELLAALRLREVSVTGISDYFDLAEALLDQGAISRALARLSRAPLSVLSSAAHLASTGARPTAASIAERIATFSDTPPSVASIAESVLGARALLLIDADTHADADAGSADADATIVPYDAVVEAFAAWPAKGLPDEATLAGERPPASLDRVDLEPGSTTDQLAAERAFATVAAVAELLAELAEQPARELSRGGLALPDSKRLAGAMSLDLDDVPAVVSIAERAGLVVLESSSWLVTEASTAWLLDSSVSRWTTLAEAWLDALPADIRGILRARSRARWGDGLLAFVNWDYPMGGEWLQGRVDDVVRDAEFLGLAAHSGPSTPGSALLESGAAEAAASIAGMLPAEVERVYVQHDLSIVSPGPLAPALDARLRTMADVESRALAATYRVSAASLTRAITSGESAESLLDFLRGVSLTGIPQPLDYLIQDVASRHGLLRVGGTDADPRGPAGGEGARSYVWSDDPEALAPLEVDTRLSAVGLSRVTANRLESRFDRDVVFWALTDARYPAAAEDAEGRILLLTRGRVGRASIPAGNDPLEALVARLVADTSTSVESTTSDWVARQLDLAIRNRIALTVRVAMPNGAEFDYLLEPTGLSGGRLRARDRRADIERTLPLSSITAILAPDPR